MKVLLLMGPTASGKSALALDLAEKRGREIVSADSRQIYRGLRLGTAQPDATEKARVRHHLVDFLSPESSWSAQAFAESALSLIRERENATPLLVGGTGFYLRSLRQGLFPLDLDETELRAVRERLEELPPEERWERLRKADPESAGRLHPNDRQRVLRALEVWEATGLPLSEHHRRGRRKPEGIQWIPVLLKADRSWLHARIEARLDAMLAGGWYEEVEGLLARGVSQDAPGMQSLGYPEIAGHLRGELGRDEARERILVRTRQYARRQDIWFAKEEGAVLLDPRDPGTPARLEELLPA